MKTAKALAALAGRTKVQQADVDTAAEMALPHRMRRQSLMEVDDNAEKIRATRR